MTPFDLGNAIRAYYIEHADELSDEKRFHFASRLAAWSGDKWAYTEIERQRPYRADASRLNSSLTKLLASSPSESVYAYSRRQPYFAQFPKLVGIELALFRVRHLFYIYGIDARKEFFQIITRETLIELRDALLAKPDALHALSTYAVNVIYLIDQFMLENNRGLISEDFLPLVDSYDLENQEDLQLMIYLYTHCILGETIFYKRIIPEKLRTAYNTMLTIVEDAITAHYPKCSLDTKLEFIVCLRILNRDSPLIAKIHAECLKSVSSNGKYLIDQHNAFAGTRKTTLSNAEHRNVLFLMGLSPYAPRDIVNEMA